MENISKYVQIFISDSRKELEEMNQLLQELDKDSNNLELINALFRKAHSLKGMGATMGYDRVSSVSHAIEEPLQAIRDGKSSVTRKMIDLLFEGTRVLEQLVEETVSGASPKQEYRSLIDRLKAYRAEEGASPQEKPAITYQPPKAVSVDTQTLDALINVVGEIIIQRSRLIEMNKPIFSSRLEEQMQAFDTLIRDLYTQILKIRMMPVSLVTGFLYRTVRELAARQSKQVDFFMEGDQEIKIDRTVLEELMDPLIHLIRNAIDHGIEAPAIRNEKAKPKGRIWVSFSKERDMVRIEVKDDGQGIDPNRLKQEAVERGVLSRERVDSISDEDALMVLCLPGFTTTKDATEVSGRGVGLDVVKERVEALGGTLRIYSESGSGSRFVLKVPSDIHIIFAFLIRVGTHSVAVPMTKVLTTRTINLDAGADSFTLNNEEVSLFWLGDLLDMDTLSGGKRGISPVLVVETTAGKAGLIVDELMGIEQIFVKPLGEPLDAIERFSGVTILGNGRLVLVLDTERLRR
ncbi:MAG: chemotaxis protein CheA [Deltaproteobacteria bacterium]|nr:chemotaxis protein CheA [Deltaproteobacteria bacterium]